jgi:hypothetical protein
LGEKIQLTILNGTQIELFREIGSEFGNNDSEILDKLQYLPFYTYSINSGLNELALGD